MISSNPGETPALFVVFTNTVGSFLRYASMQEHPEEEEIHEFRLVVKKLRTILDLLDFIAGGRGGTKGLRSMLPPVFDAAGGIRTAQMNLNLLRKGGASHTAALGQALSDDEAASRRELASLLTTFDRGRFARLAAETAAVIGGFETARVSACAERFLLGRYAEAFRISREVKTPRDLHEVRKNIKSARNVLELIATSGLGKRSGIEAKIVRAIDQLLGEWHDEIVFRKRIKELGPGIVRPGISKEVKPPPGVRGGGRRGRMAPIVGETRSRMAALRRALELR